ARTVAVKRARRAAKGAGLNGCKCKGIVLIVSFGFIKKAKSNKSYGNPIKQNVRTQVSVARTNGRQGMSGQNHPLSADRL
ncbi:MAG: hypothetical protein WBO07_08065, partial [Formosimonas sp.]